MLVILIVASVVDYFAGSSVVSPPKTITTTVGSPTTITTTITTRVAEKVTVTITPTQTPMPTPTSPLPHRPQKFRFVTSVSVVLSTH
jgi:hypothetical protein